LWKFWIKSKFCWMCNIVWFFLDCWTLENGTGWGVTKRRQETTAPSYVNGTGWSVTKRRQGTTAPSYVNPPKQQRYHFVAYRHIANHKMIRCDLYSCVNVNNTALTKFGGV
jgi:hypothetical protein